MFIIYFDGVLKKYFFLSLSFIVKYPFCKFIYITSLFVILFIVHCNAIKPKFHEFRKNIRPKLDAIITLIPLFNKAYTACSLELPIPKIPLDTSA